MIFSAPFFFPPFSLNHSIHFAAPTAFAYTSEPQAVPTKRTRAKYREQTDDLELSNNIMFDRRVVRGNTYAAQV